MKEELTLKDITESIKNFFKVGIKRHFQTNIFIKSLFIIIFIFSLYLAYNYGISKTGMDKIERAEWYLGNLDKMEGFNQLFCKNYTYCMTGGSCMTNCAITENTTISELKQIYYDYGFVSRMGLNVLLSDICN